MLVEKSRNIIDVAKSGPVGIVSALMFLWTVIWLMFQTERIFNNVWGIRRIPRNIFKRFGFYFGLLLLIPFVVIIFSYGIALATNATSLIGLNASEWRFLGRFLSWFILYIGSALVFSVLFKYIPAVKVQPRYAFRSALIAGVIFVLFQYLYMHTQMFVGRLNQAYGVLAAIPLFLIFLNFSWQIIIFGAQLTYSFQNVDQYKVSAWDNESKS